MKISQLMAHSSAEEKLAFTQEYAKGYTVGVADAYAGVVEPEAGHPDNPIWQRGYRHGKADYVRRVKSLLVGAT